MPAVSMLVAQFTQSTSEAAGQGWVWTDLGSQESRVCAPSARPACWKVHCMHFAILPLVPHQRGREVSMRMSHPCLPAEPWIRFF